jgi:hypothetical protein
MRAICGFCCGLRLNRGDDISTVNIEPPGGTRETGEVELGRYARGERRARSHTREWHPADFSPALSLGSRFRCRLGRGGDLPTAGIDPPGGTREIEVSPPCRACHPCHLRSHPAPLESTHRSTPPMEGTHRRDPRRAKCSGSRRRVRGVRSDRPQPRWRACAILRPRGSEATPGTQRQPHQPRQPGQPRSAASLAGTPAPSAARTVREHEAGPAPSPSWAKPPFLLPHPCVDGVPTG